MAEKVNELINGTGFNSVSSFVTYILRQILSESGSKKHGEEVFTEKDEKKVKDRLKSLGYLE